MVEHSVRRYKCEANALRSELPITIPYSSSVAVGQARPGRGYFLLGLALAGPHIFVRGRPVAWPAVGRVGRAKTGQASVRKYLALAGRWPQ